MTAGTIATVKKNRPRSDFDSPWKHSLQLYFRDFLEFCLPHIAAEIDWSKGYESLEKELNAITRDAEIGNRVADKLIKVWEKGGQKTLKLCHLEVDGNPKDKLPQRMMIYRYRIHDSRRLPIISIAILIDDDPDWRVDHYRQACFGSYQEIGYIVVKILDYQKRRKELEAMSNRFAIIILAQLTVLETKRDPKARLNAKATLTRLLYSKDYTKQDIIQLFILIDWLITLPDDLILEYHKELKQIEEESKVQFITTPERVGRMEGFKQGLEKGLKQGLNQGLNQGLQQGEANVLIRLLQRRFSHIPSNYLDKIQQADVTTLLTWAERTLDAASLEEVFN